MKKLVILVGLSALMSFGSMAVFAQESGAREEAAAPSGSDGDDDYDDGDADSDVLEEAGGEKVKVFRFGGLDISGRLKSPQLLYFLNRLRAEFDRPKLPHRSFMPELVRSTKAKGM